MTALDLIFGLVRADLAGRSVDARVFDALEQLDIIVTGDGA
jgi:hypothetical protein